MLLTGGQVEISTEKNETISSLTDWSEAQERGLESLFPALEEQNGRIINTLAAYARQVGA